jgi:ribosomal protein S18 acetylase RimI-like enzyme
VAAVLRVRPDGGRRGGRGPAGAAGIRISGELTIDADIEVQELAPDDWRTWRELRLAALAEAPAAFGSRLADWQGDGDREERWRGRLALAGSYNLVARLDGVPVGMASGVPGDIGGEVELISMWVSPAARGHGIGDLLIQRITGWGTAAGAHRLVLAVVPDNAPARALYRRNGFVDTGEQGDLGPDGIREVIMARPLP